MSKQILINSTPEETRIALLENKKLTELFLERSDSKGIIGNIYKGKVVRVLPGMQAAFVDIGHERAAFLYAGDFWKSKHNVEDAEDEEAFDEKLGSRRRRLTSEEVPPINELVREGQEILVQVAKGPIGTKGARLTCHISMPGRFIVFMPTLKNNGVSRKIESYEKRKDLKRIIDRFRSKEGGFIVRTAAEEGTSEKQIKNDVDYLLNLWTKIDRKYKSSAAPRLLHYDLDLTTRLIRDHLEDDVEELIVDAPEHHRKVLRFIRNFNIDLREKVRLYTGQAPIFDHYSVEPELQKALNKRVWLKSGGYLIIETTEALTSIDVNTGRFVGKKTLEETILKTNLEAAEEIVKQLRLRNIGGIIIIDFIDMEKDSSKEQVYRFLQNLVRDDKAKTTVLKVSNLGLVEMTRKRQREPLVRYLTETCSTCDGRGFTKSKTAIVLEVLRHIRRELPTCEGDHLFVKIHPDILQLLNATQKEAVVALEKDFQKGVKLGTDSTFHLEQIAVQGLEPIEVTSPEPLQPQKAPVQEAPYVWEEDETADDDAEYQADLKAIDDAKQKKLQPNPIPDAFEAPVIREQAEPTATIAADEEDDNEEDPGTQNS